MGDAIKDKRKKETEYLRATGRSIKVPAGPSMQRVRTLHDVHGMTLRAIAEAVGIGLGALYAIYAGHRTRDAQQEPIKDVFRTTEQAIMAVKPPQRTINIALPSNRGARLPIHGARRRLNALTYEGFPLEWLGEVRLSLGSNNVYMIFMYDAKNRYMHTQLLDRVKLAYTELEGKSPDDFGLTPSAQARTRHYAIRRGAAPRHCWDDDTIDDPNAIAEWTGHCGTPQGYWIHKRPDQPKFWSPYGSDRRSGRFVIGCPPCRKAGRGGE